MGKGENADYQHFLLFLKCFLKPSSLGSLKVSLFDRVENTVGKGENAGNQCVKNTFIFTGPYCIGFPFDYSQIILI